MPITYNAGQTRIELNKEVGKGENWTNAYTIEDILTANVTEKFFFANDIYVADGVSILVNTATFLKIKSCTLSFINSSVNANLLQLAGGGQIQLGENVDGKLSEGVVINCRGLTTPVKRLYVSYAYDSMIVSKPTTTGFLGGVYLYNADGCKISGGGTENLYNGLYNIKNSQVINAYYGTRSPSSGSVFQNVMFNNCHIGVWLYIATNITLRSVTALNSISVDIQNRGYGNNNQENTLVDCVYGTYQNTFATHASTTQETYCILNIDEYFDLVLNDQNGNKLEGASVKLYNKNDELVFDLTTDASGKIERQEVRRIRDEIWKRLPDLISVRTINTYSPFTLVIEKTGYVIYTDIFDISGKVDLKISLKLLPLQISAVEITDTSVIGASDGALTITAEGGDGTYQYSINGTDYQVSNGFTGLAKGDYTVYVKDGQDVVASFGVEISEPSGGSGYSRARIVNI